MADPDARTGPRRNRQRTAFADVWDRREAELRASARDRFARGHQSGNPDVGLAWAGEETNLITAVEPAGNLVTQIVTQAGRLLRGTSRREAPDPVCRHPRAYRPVLHIPAQDHHGIEARAERRIRRTCPLWLVTFRGIVVVECSCGRVPAPAGQ
jgi:hypothetical protein